MHRSFTALHQTIQEIRIEGNGVLVDLVLGSVKHKLVVVSVLVSATESERNPSLHTGTTNPNPPPLSSDLRT